MWIQKMSPTFALLVCVLASAPAKAQSFRDRLVVGIEEYGYEKAKEGLIKWPVKKLDSKVIEEVVDFALSCKGAVPTTPASLLPCVAKIFEGNDVKQAMRNDKEWQSRVRQLQKIKGDCLNFLEKAVPIWKQQSIEAAEGYEKFLAKDYRPKLARAAVRSREIRKRQEIFQTKAAKHNSKAEWFQAEYMQAEKSAAQSQASLDAEADAVRNTIAAYKAKKADYRNRNVDAFHWKGVLQGQVKIGRISVQQYDNACAEYERTGQFPVIPCPKGVNAQNWNDQFGEINRAEADLRAMRLDIESRSAGLHAMKNSGQAGIQGVPGDLNDRVTEFQAARSSLEELKGAIEQEWRDLREEIEPSAQQKDQFEKKIDELIARTRMFKICLDNLSTLSSMTNRWEGDAELSRWSTEIAVVLIRLDKARNLASSAVKEAQTTFALP